MPGMNDLPRSGRAPLEFAASPVRAVGATLRAAIVAALALWLFAAALPPGHWSMI